jgi:hypothetical protein
MGFVSASLLRLPETHRHVPGRTWPPDPKSFSSGILELRQSIGNRALFEMLSVQALGQSRSEASQDPREREADAVARRVLTPGADGSCVACDVGLPCTDCGDDVAGERTASPSGAPVCG